MQKHTRIYMNHFGYGQDDFIPCEVTGGRSVDIHHIDGRIGPDANKIENLMALCRNKHDDAHNEKISKEELKRIHTEFLNRFNHGA